MKKLRVTVDGRAYDVLVEVLDGGPAASPVSTPNPMRVASAPVVASASVSAPVVAPMSAPRATGGLGDVLSPLAGKIVSVDVKPGAVVTEGAQVATIEAMKMNTYIYAPKSGTVSAVHVAAGDAVQEGALLIQIA
jgi:biotin carboxyl carrier protein